MRKPLYIYQCDKCGLSHGTEKDAPEGWVEFTAMVPGSVTTYTSVPTYTSVHFCTLCSQQLDEVALNLARALSEAIPDSNKFSKNSVIVKCVRRALHKLNEEKENG